MSFLKETFKYYYVASSSMDSNHQPPLKSDSIAPRDMPSSETIERTEYTIKVVCEKTANGKRSCKIQDIATTNPQGEQPAQESSQLSQKESPPINSVVPQAQTLSDSTPNDSKDCDLCEILADMTRPVKDEKTLSEEDTPLAAQGRRLSLENKGSVVRDTLREKSESAAEKTAKVDAAAPRWLRRSPPEARHRRMMKNPL